MKVAVVAHHSRIDQLGELEDIADIVFVDEGSRGSLWNHRRALEWANSQEERVWIVEDDAILSSTFLADIETAGEEFPDQLISGYLGTGRPVMYQSVIPEVLATNPDYVTIPHLLHGICYSVPKDALPVLLKKLRHFTLDHGADYAVGACWGKDVIYLNPSIVDHKDGVSVEINRKPYTEARKAWNFKG